MVTFVNAPESMSSTLAQALSGVASAGIQNYTERADEQALQKAVRDLPEGYSMRDLLTAVNGTRAAPEAKERFYKNAFGLAEHEEKIRTNKANEQLTIAKTEAQNAATNLKALKLEEDTRHNKAMESLGSSKLITAENIATGKYQSAETIAALNNVRLTNKDLSDAEARRDKLDFEKIKAENKLEQAKNEFQEKMALANAAEARKDTQGAEKLRIEAETLKAKIEHQEKELDLKTTHLDRQDTLAELKRQDYLDAQTQEANIKLQELDQKYNQLAEELEEKKREFDLNYELSLSKDVRDQDKAQADIDKIAADIQFRQDQLNSTERFRDEQMAIAREKNQIAWEQLKKTDPSEFQNVMQRNVAQEYTKLQHDIPEMIKARETMNEVQALGDKLGWSGAAANNIWGTKNGAELEAKSYLLLKAPIKVFNPSGPLAAKKLDQLRQIYHIKASDTPVVKKGKLEALRAFNDQALKIAEDRMKLIQQYNGAPPLNVMEESERNSESMVDAMLDYNMNAEPVNIKGLPDPSVKRNGQWPTLKLKSGEILYSDGLRWLKKK